MRLYLRPGLGLPAWVSRSLNRANTFATSAWGYVLPAASAAITNFSKRALQSRISESESSFLDLSRYHQSRNHAIFSSLEI